MSTEFNSFLRDTWATMDQVTASMWHNFHLINCSFNLPAIDALGYNVAYCQPHVLAFTDNMQALDVDRRLPLPMPSLVNNFDLLSPAQTVYCPGALQMPLSSWPAVNTIPDFSIEYGQMKARRSYWTGKPRRRRNLPA